MYNMILYYLLITTFVFLIILRKQMNTMVFFLKNKL
jgi:hypothetical protein